jgi:predicted DCC family thiol-disulfide oxidoreductase YuxK
MPNENPQPGSIIVLFDGLCNFCSYWPAFIIKRDPRGIFKFASLQSEIGRKIYAGHGLNPDDLESFMVLTPAGPKVRSDGTIAIALGLGGLWKFGGLVLRLVPRPLRDWGYGVFARNRYRLFGKRDSCLVPTPEIRARFLE